MTKLQEEAFEVNFTRLRPYAVQKFTKLSVTGVEVATVPAKKG